MVPQRGGTPVSPAAAPSSSSPSGELTAGQNDEVYPVANKLIGHLFGFQTLVPTLRKDVGRGSNARPSSRPSGKAKFDATSRSTRFPYSQNAMLWGVCSAVERKIIAWHTLLGLRKWLFFHAH